MKTPSLALTAICMFGFGTAIQAQNDIPASGANAVDSGGSVSYTVGLVFYTTSTGTNGNVAQGVQQPFEISVVTGIEEAKGINLVCSAYPNPATDNVKLKVENYETENLIYQLYDIRGNLLENKKIEGNETSIVMSNLVPGTYFLKVSDNNKLSTDIMTILKKNEN
jgi:hypothetical protein